MCLGIPARVIAVDEGSDPLMGEVDFGGVRRRVCLAFLPETRVGEHVIVHVGFGISTVDEAEAERTLSVLRAMGDLVEAELGERLPGEAPAAASEAGA